MQMRNEVNDLDAQMAFEGDDRDEKMDDDLEALGGTEEDLDLSALREFTADAVELAAEERGSSSYSVLRLSGALVDNLDETLVEELSHRDFRCPQISRSRECRRPFHSHVTASGIRRHAGRYSGKCGSTLVGSFQAPKSRILVGTDRNSKRLAAHISG